MTFWRSTRRQRTTPSTAGSGPVSTISANSAFCGGDSRGAGPLHQASLRPSGPDALNRCTQSLSVCRSMPPIFAASSRLLPSLTAASDRSRRLWLASFEALASRRSSAAEKSVRIFTGDPMARILPAPKNHRSTRAGIPPRVSRQSRWYKAQLAPVEDVGWRRRYRYGYPVPYAYYPPAYGYYYPPPAYRYYAPVYPAYPYYAPYAYRYYRPYYAPY